MIGTKSQPGMAVLAAIPAHDARTEVGQRDDGSRGPRVAPWPRRRQIPGRDALVVLDSTRPLLPPYRRAARAGSDTRGALGIRAPDARAGPIGLAHGPAARVRDARTAPRPAVAQRGSPQLRRRLCEPRRQRVSRARRS